jgi:hypothetical protein
MATAIAKNPVRIPAAYRAQEKNHPTTMSATQATQAIPDSILRHNARSEG